MYQTFFLTFVKCKRKLAQSSTQLVQLVKFKDLELLERSSFKSLLKLGQPDKLVKLEHVFYVCSFSYVMEYH